MMLQIEIDKSNIFMLITSLEYAKEMYARLQDFEQGNIDPDSKTYWQRRINILNDVINQISVQDKKEY